MLSIQTVRHLTEKYRFELLPLASGLALAAAFQYPACFFLAWLALVPLFVSLAGPDKLTKGQAIRALALFAMAFYLLLVSFLFALHPLDYLGFGNMASLALISLGWLLLTAWETVGFLLLGLAFVKLRPSSGPAARLLLLCALWLLLEWLQGLSPLGFTWGRLAVAQASQPLLIQGAALGGSLLVSALVLLVNALLTLACLRRDERFALLALVVFALNLGGGALRMNLPNYEIPRYLSIGIVQGTLPSQLKWQEDTAAQNRTQYYAQSLAAARAGAQLILWPETSLAEGISEDKLSPDNFYQMVARDCQVPLLVGAVWRQSNGDSYNALLYAQEDSLDMVYAKRHLVPFGEYLPFGGLLKPLLPGLDTFMADGLRQYQGEGLILAANSRLGGLICFESIFAPLAQSSVAAGAEALLLASNDSWFWGTPAMRQHYWQAQLRAVEQNRYILRAANAGYSGIIDNYGRSLAEIAPEEKGFLLAETPLLREHTRYFHLGEWVLYVALAIIFRYALKYLTK